MLPPDVRDEGRLASASEHGVSRERRAPGNPATRVLIIGAGPAGLAVSHCLAREGVAFDLVDRSGEPGGAYRAIPRSTRLLSLARHISLPGLPFHCETRYTTAGEYLAYLTEYAAWHGIVPRRERVGAVIRTGEGFGVQADDPLSARYDAVVVATGVFDHPVVPNLPGLAGGAGRAGVFHTRNFPGTERLIGRRVLVVGGGISAVQTAEACAASGIDVTVTARRPVRVLPRRALGVDLQNLLYHLGAWLPAAVVRTLCRGTGTLPGVDEGFRRYRREGRIRVRGPMREITREGVVFRGGGIEHFDVVLLATGYRYVLPFLPPDVERGSDGRPLVVRGESVSWPGLFFAGLQCGLRLAGGSLRGIAKDAPALAALVAARCGRAPS
jgi:putative flavoprotein involved in K+ transport